THGNAISGVRSPGSTDLPAETVVLATGSWSAQTAASAGVGLRIDPVRGQNLRLRMPAGLRLSTNVYGDETILVPRPDGRLIAGVTIESVGFDSRATTDGIRSIMERSAELVPALADAVVEQAYAGLRPASADGLPIIGRPNGVGGLVIATAHYRMGIALSPITGRLVADHIADGAELPHEFRPDRGINVG
ncbi:MAG: FAD-dependent oxidoreductase, partial [Dehalococcoidia bacterium]|nr:FAD-dependent oxidoreductase [Dehalococcoidia bacterium]